MEYIYGPSIYEAVCMARCMVSCWLICAVSVALKGGRPSVYSTSLSSMLPCDLQMDSEVNLSGFCTDNLTVIIRVT